MALAVGAVVVARQGSERLPGKMLREFGGRPLLGHVLDRLARAGEPDGVIVATSAEQGDDGLAAWCTERGVDVHRGPAADVLARVIGAAEAGDFDAVARVNGDSPWLDPELLDRAIALFRAEAPDLVTNLLERDWPYGISAEVASVESLREIDAEAGAEDREHVTARFYSEPERFAILNIPSEHAAPAALRLTVDTEADGRLFSDLLDDLGAGAPLATSAEVIAAAQALETSEREKP